MYYLAKREYKYALRICAYFNDAIKKVQLSIQDLSKKLLISKHLTTKIIVQLKKTTLLFLTKT
jgi:DNA-binding IscR family transcriptional regulator